MALIIAGGLITLTGFLDDWWGMDALIKLAGQIARRRHAGLRSGIRLPCIPLPNCSGRTASLDSTLEHL